MRYGLIDDMDEDILEGIKTTQSVRNCSPIADKPTEKSDSEEEEVDDDDDLLQLYQH